MRKKHRIKKNEEFQKIFKQGTSFANRQLVIYYIHDQKQTNFRAGISVGKRIGNAVLRNRIKRLIRESFLSLEDQIKPTVQMIIVARNPTKNMNYHEIRKSLLHLLKRQKLLK